MTVGEKRSANRGSYITLIISPKIGEYAAENGPARATRHLSVPDHETKSFSGKSA